MKATSKGGFEARRLTVTRPDGTEVNKMVWASDEHQAKVDPSIDDIFSQFPDQQLREALLTRLTERMFDESKSYQEPSTQKTSEADGSRRRTRPRRSRG